jgi:hypothetical protein
MSHAEGGATSPPGSAAGVLRQIARCHGETGRNVAPKLTALLPLHGPSLGDAC